MEQFREKRALSLPEQLSLTLEQLAEYEQERLYQQEIFSSSQLAPPQKLVLLALRNIIRATREDQIRQTETLIQQIAQATDLKDAKVTRCLKELAEQGVILREKISDPPGKGKGEDRIFLRLREKPDRTLHGRHHLSCPNCGNEALHIRTTYSCRTCGYTSQM
jgi:DNA-binding MarR family transcriptional regulator